MKHKIFLINLNRSPERLADVTAQLDQLGLTFDRVAGVDGQELATEQIAAHFDHTQAQQRYHYDLTAGEIGCYLSHRLCWQKIVDEQLDYAIILEDDVRLNSEFALIPEAVAKLSRPWDYLKMACPCKPRRYSVLEHIDGLSLVSYRQPPTATCAQAVSLSGAQKLLHARRRFFRPVDIDLQWHWEVPLNIFGLIPYVADNNHSFDSEIFKIASRYTAEKRKLIGIKEKLRYQIEKLRFGRTLNPTDPT